MGDTVTFALALLAYGLLTLAVAATVRPTGGRARWDTSLSFARTWLVRGAFVAALAHVACVWHFRFAWDTGRAVEKGIVTFALFHGALALLALGTVGARGHARLRLFPVLAWLAVAPAATAAPFRYPELEALRVPVVALTALGAGTLLLWALRRSRRRWATAALLLLALAPTSVSDEPPAVAARLIPRKWLVLPDVDIRARRPISPNAVFAKHLLDPAAPPPIAGEMVTGETGKPGTWRAVEADAAGSVPGDDVGWAYAALDVEKAGVWMMDLSAASTCFVNGTPFVGDVYALGTGKVPVAFRAGVNHLYVTGTRGPFRLSFEPPPAPVFVAPWDATLPDIVRGTSGESLVGAVVVVNATERRVSGLSLAVDGTLASSGFSLLPLGVLKVPIDVPQPPPDATSASFTVGLLGAEATAPSQPFAMEMRSVDEAYRVTFRSGVDGSTQFYALLLPSASPAGKKASDTGFVLTLHGAGVDALAQARSYSPKPDFVIVAPTNRRPYGFDWQDWGRADAYEPLYDSGALGLSWAPPARLYLTGHSMGGHGTWHLAVNDPDQFVAIGPSAGWASFDTYTGERPKGAFDVTWRGADGGSDTLGLLRNLAKVPTYVLHGTADDKVPKTEADRLVAALRAAGGAPEVHFQEGAGHWWDGDASPGVDCVDWPPMFEMFRKAAKAKPSDDIDWVSPDPWTDSRDHWISVEQVQRYGKPFEVHARRSPSGLLLEMKNVLRYTIHGADQMTLDEDYVVGPDGPKPQERIMGSSVPGFEKSSRRCGPFKRAFGEHFLLVVGTAGTDDEDAALLAKARHDAIVWWYRGNGFAEICTDEEHRADPQTGRSVILYGNRDTNSAYDREVKSGCPVEVRRGKVTVGTKTWEGDDLAVLFVYPRKGQKASIGVVGSTGVRGTRLTFTTAYFASGVGYPDYTVWGSDALKSGDAGVRAAGFFDYRWQLQDPP